MDKHTEKVLTGWMKEHEGTVIPTSMVNQFIYYQGEHVPVNVMRQYIKLKPIIERKYYSFSDLVQLINKHEEKEHHLTLDKTGNAFDRQLIGYKIEGWRF